MCSPCPQEDSCLLPSFWNALWQEEQAGEVRHGLFSSPGRGLDFVRDTGCCWRTFLKSILHRVGTRGGKLIRLIDHLLRDPGMITLEIPLLSWKWRERCSLYFSGPDALRLVWFISSSILKSSSACVFTVLITVDSESSSPGFPFSNKVEYGCFSTWQGYSTFPTSCLGWCRPAYTILWLQSCIFFGRVQRLSADICTCWMAAPWMMSAVNEVNLRSQRCDALLRGLSPLIASNLLDSLSLCFRSRCLPKILVICGSIRV